MMTFTLSCWAIGLLLLLLGIAARHAAIREVARARAWPQVQGVIVGASLVGSGQATYLPQVNYAYDVGGRGYASDRRRPGGTPYFYRVARARAMLDAFPVGAAVTVRYRPDRPARAAIELEPQSYATPVFLLLGGAVLVSAVIGSLVLATQA